MANTAENLTIVEGPEKPKLTPTELVVQDTGEFAMLFDSARFNQAWRAATMFSNSKLVPADFRGSPESCFVAMHMAVRLNLDPMMVMQKTYIIHGRPGMEAQLIIAMVNARGPFNGPIQWEASGEGDNRQWTAYAIHKATGERCEATVTWAMAKAEGWTGKSGSKWMTIPDLMGRYRSATFLARLYCPEVIMGLSTVDELQDMEAIELEATPVPMAPKIPQAEKIKDKIKRDRAAKTPDTPLDAPPTEQVPEPPGETNEAADGGTESQLPANEAQVNTIKQMSDPDKLMAILAEYEVVEVADLSQEQAKNIVARLIEESS